MSTAPDAHEHQVRVLLDDMRDHGFSDDDVRRVELALLATRVEHVALVVGPDPSGAEYARRLPNAELERLLATNPRDMYEYGWQATATARGPNSRPVANHGLLLLQEEGVSGNAAWHIPERTFTFSLDEIANLFVYSFEHIDVRSFERHPAEVLDVGPDELELLTRGVATLFEQHGWEGDGDVCLLWLPPFVLADPDNTWGIAVWHVKQSNNGTSWLAATAALDFPALTRASRVGRRT